MYETADYHDFLDHQYITRSHSVVLVCTLTPLRPNPGYKECNNYTMWFILEKQTQHVSA
jgi:hypothetical protein